MKSGKHRNQPGRVRDAIVSALSEAAEPLSISEIQQKVEKSIGPTPTSSIRSYLLLNTPGRFVRRERGRYLLSVEYAMGNNEDEVPQVAEEALAYNAGKQPEPFRHGRAELYLGDCFEWFADQPDCAIHAIVTDPPYGLQEYTPQELGKLREGRGGVWRMPPSFDGSTRSPLPRFTVLNQEKLRGLEDFFFRWGKAVLPKLVPGANVVMASNPLLSFIVSKALADAGLERRGELVRLTMTMRGGDRPKNAEEEFSDVSVMPRSMWEPWLLFRRPLDGRVQDNLRKWGTGGFRRIGPEKPFGDVIKSSPTGRVEKSIAKHPSLKPQAFMRQIVRASLPLGKGVVVDPFAGSGATLAAAEAVGYASKGVERDETYYQMACSSFPRLSRLILPQDYEELPLVGLMN